MKGQVAPIESRGKHPGFPGQRNNNQGPKNSEVKKVVTIVPENSKTQTEGQEKIAKLNEALKQADIEESLKGVSTMINVLSAVKGNILFLLKLRMITI